MTILPCKSHLEKLQNSPIRCCFLTTILSEQNQCSTAFLIGEGRGRNSECCCCWRCECSSFIILHQVGRSSLIKYAYKHPYLFTGSPLHTKGRLQLSFLKKSPWKSIHKKLRLLITRAFIHLLWRCLGKYCLSILTINTYFVSMSMRTVTRIASQAKAEDLMLLYNLPAFSKGD